MGLPIKLFTAVPKNVSDADYSRKLKQAKVAGVGVLEVDQHSGTVIQSALSLSLAALRPLDAESFPSKLREPLAHADQTFRDGEPGKACSLVYDELEARFRNVAKKTVAKNLWSNPNGLNLEKAPWANVVDDVDRGINRSNPLTKEMTPALLARIKGVTSHRNDSGHKPKNTKELVRRDRELRTRFEGGVDLFKEFLTATRKFRV
jgi:hypothetical protein